MVWPFKRKSQPASKKPMDSHELLQLLTVGGETASGLYINRRTALEIATVLQCVRVLCNGVAQVPFRLYQLAGDQRHLVPKHPLYRLVYHSPNEWQTSFDFRSMITMHLALAGNAYVWINRVRGEVAELLPYPPGTVTTQKDGFATRYWITTANGQFVEIPAKDMWHIKHLPWDHYGGLDAVNVAREVLGLAKATETYGSKLFKSGGRPAGLLSTPATLDPEQRKGLREDWEAINAGLNNANKVGVIWGDLKYTALAANNDESQFLETRKFQLEEICRAFGVNPIKVFYSDKNSTYASVEQMNIAHVTDTLMPLYANIEQSGNAKLLTEDERLSGHYLKLEAKGLMRGSVKERGEYYRLMFNIGAMSPNDIRELEDLNPYEGGGHYFVPMNMASPEKAGQEEGTDGNQK